MPEFAYQYWLRVRTELQKKQSTFKDLANAIGVSYDVVRQWSSKNRYPKGDIPNKIASFLNVSPDFLFSGASEKESITPEMAFVRDNAEANAIVKLMMEDPSILPHISALAMAGQRNVKVMGKKDA